MQDRTGTSPGTANKSRRDFMKKTAVAATAASLIGTSKSWAGANDTIRVGIVGLHGRGGPHMRAHYGMPNVAVTALCDVDERQIDMRLGELAEINYPKPKTYTDIRRMLDDDVVDAVSIATPNHWHSLQSIWACQAGKHVYVEKPLSHNVWEGRQLVKAARKYNCIVQHGTQARSYPAMQEAVRKLREGVIGEVYMGKGICYKWRDTIGHTPDSQPPAGVDYDQWEGPAKDRPFSENRFHYNWHWQWPYGNGDIGNQGVHQMDIARWGLGVDLPKKVQSMGGHFMFDDDQTTPNVLISAMSYPDVDKMLVFEVRHWITNKEGGIGEGHDNTIGNIFWGSEGYMVIDGDSYRTYLGRDCKPGPSGEGGGKLELHFANFIEAIRAGNPDILNADVEEGHYSSALCHLANIAYRVGRTIEVDPEKETIIGDREAKRLIKDDQRGYRKPYTVPSKI